MGSVIVFFSNSSVSSTVMRIRIPAVPRIRTSEKKILYVKAIEAKKNESVSSRVHIHHKKLPKHPRIRIQFILLKNPKILM